MVKNLILNSIRSFGFDLVKRNSALVKDGVPVDMEPAFVTLYEQCKPYTMTSIERMYALYKAVEYVVKHNIPGDFVECGVWRGGSSMMIAHTLKSLGITDRKIYLYDTYEGMPAPSEKDKDATGRNAQLLLDATVAEKETAIIWCYADLDDVTRNMTSTDYPLTNISFVKGMVENTIPQTISSHIALLRLDTDWYESTYHEMVHLYPHLVNRGVLIIDDYGHWQGSRQAIDKYLTDNAIPLLLNRIDYTGRIAIKP